LNNSSKKVIYIDTEGSFSVDRFKQLNPDNYKELMDRIIFLNPTNYDEQKSCFNKLKTIFKNDDFEKKYGLIVMDSIAMLYRLEIGKAKDVYSVNRGLGDQMGTLSEVARKANLPILVTSQVYADFEDKEKVNVIGGEILKYWTKNLVEVKSNNGTRSLTIKKHRSIPKGKTLNFKIINKGIEVLE
jgi:DNA repair protein RadB